MFILFFLSIISILAGFTLGLGAVTVIDLHGFLAQKSKYWTEATTRTHKVTKPLIWIGIAFLIIGKSLLYQESYNVIKTNFEYIVFGIMILNGIFLSFVISPYLLKREKEGKSDELLDQNIQQKIKISFILSVLCWWGEILYTSWQFTHLIL